MSVELLDTMGDDLAIVLAARVSYAKESTWDVRCARCDVLWKQEPHVDPCCGQDGYTKTLEPADAGLISYLARNRHGTPFEMVVFKFRVRCPIGVAREWQRHRIGSFNEVSTRYHEMETEFYVPEPEAVRTQVGKPGHYTMVSADADLAKRARFEMTSHYAAARESYKWLLEMGIAKELARNVLPLGLMTEFIWAVNLRSLTNFLSLRTAPSALLEIRQEAEQVEQHVARIVPVAYAAWVEGGRQSL